MEQATASVSDPPASTRLNVDDGGEPLRQTTSPLDHNMNQYPEALKRRSEPPTGMQSDAAKYYAKGSVEAAALLLATMQQDHPASGLERPDANVSMGHAEGERAPEVMEMDGPKREMDGPKADAPAEPPARTHADRVDNLKGHTTATTYFESLPKRSVLSKPVARALWGGQATARDDSIVDAHTDLGAYEHYAPTSPTNRPFGDRNQGRTSRPSAYEDGPAPPTKRLRTVPERERVPVAVAAMGGGAFRIIFNTDEESAPGVASATDTRRWATHRVVELGMPSPTAASGADPRLTAPMNVWSRANRFDTNSGGGGRDERMSADPRRLLPMNVSPQAHRFEKNVGGGSPLELSLQSVSRSSEEAAGEETVSPQRRTMEDARIAWILQQATISLWFTAEEREEWLQRAVGHANHLAQTRLAGTTKEIMEAAMIDGSEATVSRTIADDGSWLRHQLALKARDIVQEYYIDGLDGTVQDIAGAVQRLLNTFNFVYARFDWTGGAQARGGPFRHPSIPAMIKMQFFDSGENGMGRKHPTLFEMMPLPVLAGAAAAIMYGLEQWTTGTPKIEQSFEHERYARAYWRAWRNLQAYESTCQEQCRQLQQDIWELVRPADPTPLDMLGGEEIFMVLDGSEEM